MNLKYLKDPKSSQETLIQFGPDSGRIIYKTIDHETGLTHPALILGRNFKGLTWLIHNDINSGKASLVSIDDFGSPVEFDQRKVQYPREKITDNAIAAWEAGIEFQWLSEVCPQHVNENNNLVSRDSTARNITIGILALSLMVLGLGRVE